MSSRIILSLLFCALKSYLLWEILIFTLIRQIMLRLKKLYDLFECFGLKQHVADITHTHGHTLDLIVSRQFESIISESPRVVLLFSDHFAVICNLNVTKPELMVKRRIYRNIQGNDIDQLNSDIKNSEMVENPRRLSTYWPKLLIPHSMTF